jgi:hypothetical protein
MIAQNAIKNSLPAKAAESVEPKAIFPLLMMMTKQK